MLDLGAIDIEQIASALADQTDYDHVWLVDPRTGEVVFWTSDTGVDGENHASQSLMLAIGGRGAFRRFKNQLYERHPDLIAPWHAFRDARAQRRSVEWLCDQQLISDEDAQRFAARQS